MLHFRFESADSQKNSSLNRISLGFEAFRPSISMKSGSSSYCFRSGASCRRSKEPGLIVLGALVLSRRRVPHADDTASGAKTTWVPRLETRACGHSFVDRVAAERGWVQGARPPQGSCLARKGNAANSPFQWQPAGKVSGRSPLVVTLLVQVSTCTASRA